MASKTYSESEKKYAKGLGKRLKQARLKWVECSNDDPISFRPKSLQQVSDLLKVYPDMSRTASQLSRYECGKTMPNIYLLMLLASVLRVDLNWLIGKQ